MMKRSARILVVADDDATAEVLRIVLDNRGYEVSRVSHQAEMLKRVETETPDLILLDNDWEFLDEEYMEEAQ